MPDKRLVISDKSSDVRMGALLSLAIESVDDMDRPERALRVSVGLAAWNFAALGCYK